MAEHMRIIVIEESEDKKWNILVSAHIRFQFTLFINHFSKQGHPRMWSVVTCTVASFGDKFVSKLELNKPSRTHFSKFAENTQLYTSFEKLSNSDIRDCFICTILPVSHYTQMQETKRIIRMWRPTHMQKGDTKEPSESMCCILINIWSFLLSSSLFPRL